MINHIVASPSIVSTNSTTVFNGNEAPQVSVQQDLEIPIPLTPGEQYPLSAEKAKKMTESMNRFMETTNTDLRFQYHEELKEYYVTIVDSKTNELVKEIPSKKLMDMYASMRDFLGLMVDHKI